MIFPLFHLFVYLFSLECTKMLVHIEESKHNILVRFSKLHKTCLIFKELKPSLSFESEDKAPCWESIPFDLNLSVLNASPLEIFRNSKIDEQNEKEGICTRERYFAVKSIKTVQMLFLY